MIVTRSLSNKLQALYTLDLKRICFVSSMTDIDELKHSTKFRNTEKQRLWLAPNWINLPSESSVEL